MLIMHEAEAGPASSNLSARHADGPTDELGPMSAEVEQLGVPIDEHVLTLDLRGHLRSAEVGLTG